VLGGVKKLWLIKLQRRGCNKTFYTIPTHSFLVLLGGELVPPPLPLFFLEESCQSTALSYKGIHMMTFNTVSSTKRKMMTSSVAACLLAKSNGRRQAIDRPRKRKVSIIHLEIQLLSLNRFIYFRSLILPRFNPLER
jgi:hypothetical protein